MCAHLWSRYGEQRPRFIVAEPQAANCLLHSCQRGQLSALPPERIASESTVQTGLDCKVPTSLAWKVLAQGTNDFVSIPDAAVQPCIALLRALDSPIEAGESAVAGLAAVVAAAAQKELRTSLGIGPESRVAVIICEGPVT